MTAHDQDPSLRLPPPPPLTAGRPLTQRANLHAGLLLLGEGVQQFWLDHEELLLAAGGSTSKHQPWPGGYADHLDEIYYFDAIAYAGLSVARPLPFALEDLLLVHFLHDIEKPFKHVPSHMRDKGLYGSLVSDPHQLQQRICLDYDISLSAEHVNALHYMHGIPPSEYSKTHRRAGRLAGLAHTADFWSAVGGWDEPARSGPLPLAPGLSERVEVLARGAEDQQPPGSGDE